MRDEDEKKETKISENILTVLYLCLLGISSCSYLAGL